MRHRLTCALLVMHFAFYILHLNAQEMLGVVNSNFEGVNMGIINPANTGLAEQKWNINLLAGDFFVSSNYIYIHRKDYGFLKVFKVNIMDPQYLYTYDYPDNFVDSVYYFDYFKNSKPRNMYQHVRIVGPSVLYRNGSNSFSFVTGLRTATSVERLPNDLATFIYRGQQFRPLYNQTYKDSWTRTASLTWAEIGLSYSRKIYERYGDALYAGATGKLLLGLAGAYASVGNITYMIPNADSIYFYDMNATMGFSLPINPTNNSAVIDPLIKGKGFSFDIGVTYVRMKEKRKNYKPVNSLLKGIETEYKYRAGISLLDVGFVRFNRFVQVHEFNNVQNRLWSGLLSFAPDNLQEIINSASYNLLGDSTASLTPANSLKIWLPSALSVQIDYNFGRNLFLNATFMNGIRFAQPSVKRSAILSLTPRYETKYFEVNIPFSLYEYREVQMGLSVRIFNLVIGTEKLGTFLHLTDVSGMDIYFALGFDLNIKGKEKPCDSYENYKRFQSK
jgi:hypothetical protein